MSPRAQKSHGRLESTGCNRGYSRKEIWPCKCSCEKWLFSVFLVSLSKFGCIIDDTEAGHLVSTMLELGKKEGGRESLGRKRGGRAWKEGGREGELGKKEGGMESLGRKREGAVSYTHLTLPTTGDV